MVKVIKNSLGFDVPILVYESIDEGDKAAGRVGAMKDEANNNLTYRGALADARDYVADAVEAVTGIKRQTAPVEEEYEENGEKKKRQARDTEGNPLVEFVGVGGGKYSDRSYVSYAVEKSGKSVESLQPAVTDHILKALAKTAKPGEKAPEGFAVDIKRTERAAPKPKTLPEKFKSAATSLIANGKIAKWAADYQKLLGVAPDVNDAAGKPEPEKVGWAIKAFMDARTAQDLAAMGGTPAKV